MATVVQINEQTTTWGTFERERNPLYRLFLDVEYAPETGLTLAELKREIEACLRDHAHEPRVLRKARVFALILTRGQIAIDPCDWFVDKLNHGHLLRKLVNDAWREEAAAGPIAAEASWFENSFRIGLAKSGLDTGHISPGWERMFAGGLTGLIEEAARERAALGDGITAEQVAFYDAVEIVYRAAIALAGRFAALARRMISDYPEHAERLRAIAETCERVPAHGPQTFHQALQFHWLMHELIELEGELVRSAGHFDRVFYPCYRADLDAGRLTREQAIELIQFFWFKHFARTRGKDNGKNFVLGGQDGLGRDATNELTWVALDAYERLHTPDPKLSVRYCPGSPDRLYTRVADLIRQGYNAFVLMNDEPAIEALLQRGKTIEDARLYLPIGCYEPAVDGKEAGCTMNLTLNLAKAMEYALHDGVDVRSGQQIGPHTGDPRAFTSYEQMRDAYYAQLDFLLTRSINYIAAHERQWPNINPSPFIAGTIADCLARGKDIGQGGPHYNSVGCVGAGLANAADSLLALKKAVYEERRYTMADILAALDRDFEGDEAMRQYLINRTPKWGNGHAEADALAKEIADHYCALVHSFINARGGACQAALFTLDYQWLFGRATAALPDGRKAHDGLAPGVGATPGRDKKGVTGLLDSAAKLDYTQTPNGAVLDVMLHPTAVRGEEGLAALVTLIKTFFARGGYALQFNVVDVDTLRDAQRHPERYATLQVRVTGWSVYFTTLPQFEQDAFIARQVHGL